jgi:hypothetical protein
MIKVPNLTSTTPLGALIPYYISNPADPKNPTGDAAEYWCYNDIVQFGDLGAIVKTDNQDPFQLNINNDIQ